MTSNSQMYKCLPSRYYLCIIQQSIWQLTHSQGARHRSNETYSRHPTFITSKIKRTSDSVDGLNESHLPLIWFYYAKRSASQFIP